MANAGKTHQLLVAALSKIDRKDLANIWECNLGTVSKKISGDSNINIEEMAAALAEADVQIVINSDFVMVDKKELEALKVFANLHLNKEVNND